MDEDTESMFGKLWDDENMDLITMFPHRNDPAYDPEDEEGRKMLEKIFRKKYPNRFLKVFSELVHLEMEDSWKAVVELYRTNHPGYFK